MTWPANARHVRNRIVQYPWPIDLREEVYDEDGKWLSSTTTRHPDRPERWLEIASISKGGVTCASQKPAHVLVGLLALDERLIEVYHGPGGKLTRRWWREEEGRRAA